MMNISTLLGPILGIVFLLLISCHDESAPELRYDPEELSKEVAQGVEMIYSDSAQVQFKITSPMLKKYERDNVMIEEFIDGFEIQFYDKDLKVVSQLNSKYAIRKSSEGLLVLRDSVTFINEKKDRLETNALTIDEVNDQIFTTKVFRLIKEESKDTIYGIGFTAKSDFTKLKITNYKGKREGIDISS